MFATCILFHLKCLHCLWCAISFTQNVRNAPDTFILYCTLHFTITITYCSYIYNEVLSCIFKYKKKIETINSCYYGEMPNVTKKNHIIIKSISGHLWFNGRQKSLVTGLNWNPCQSPTVGWTCLGPLQSNKEEAQLNNMMLCLHVWPAAGQYTLKSLFP